ncbi:MAG TPA: porin [Gammaproteobacteria bacterium]|nr:porin [Gammaproteobacteria bacterium]
MAKNLITAAVALGAGITSAGAVANQEEIDLLKRQLQEQQAQLDALTSAMESNANLGHGWWADTSFGGYAEVHYNNIDSESAAKDNVELDLHRFVLFFGHRFSDKVRFFSELEVEHNVAGEGKNGEVEIEQAFIEYDYAANHSAKAGVFLVPVGILNETHEPDTFYGVERNNVEKNIIPTTWWEGGVMGSGEVAAGVSYDVAVSSGLYLDIDGGKFKVRDGRQKTSEANATDLAYTARLVWNGIPGVQAGFTVQQQQDLMQGDVVGVVQDLDALLLETHVDLQKGPVGLRALYATWDIDSAIDDVAAGSIEQTGWYIEPSYKLTSKLGIFARYSEWDNQAADSSIESDYDQIDAGINYWLVETVALKADFQKTNEPNDTKKGFNLGIGWSF